MEVKHDIIKVEQNVEILENICFGQCFYFLEDKKLNQHTDYMMLDNRPNEKGIQEFKCLDLEADSITFFINPEGLRKVVIYEKVEITLFERI